MDVQPIGKYATHYRRMLSGIINNRLDNQGTIEAERVTGRPFYYFEFSVCN
jgi:hypothetical protein